MSFQFARERFICSHLLVDTLVQGRNNVMGLSLKRVVDENHRLTGNLAYSSNNMGYFAVPLYLFPLNMTPKELTVGPLHASLEPMHAEWLRGYQSMERDSKKLSQTLLGLLGKAEGYQDLRDMLPDPVCRVFPEDHPIQLLTRSRPDLYACGLEDGVPGHWDPKMVSNYAAVSSLVDAYVGYSLL